MRGILSLDVVAPSFGHQSLLNGILSEEIQLTTCYLSSPPLLFSRQITMQSMLSHQQANGKTQHRNPHGRQKYPS